MTSHYQDLGSASGWSCRVGNLFLANQRLRRHKYGISAWTRSPRLKLGSFSIDDGNGSENVSFEMNSHFFNLCRVYSNLLKMASVGEFP